MCMAYGNLYRMLEQVKDRGMVARCGNGYKTLECVQDIAIGTGCGNL